MTPWKVRSLRLTLFLPAAGVKAAAELDWEFLGGTKAEHITNRPEQQIQEGPFGAGRLLLQKQQGRLDIVYGGFPRDEPEDPVATLGVFEEAYATCASITGKLLDKLGPPVRMALGTEMVQPATTSQAAYQTLVDHMGSATFKLDGGQEFVYQINRPRESTIEPDLLMNRLTRWNAASWQPVTFELGAGPRVLSGQARIGAVVTTDVNTDGSREEPLPSNRVAALLDELRALTIEIRDRGDVA